MCKVVIFGGTTEGRLLAGYCQEQGIQAVVCVATVYGSQVLDPGLKSLVREGAMDEKEMRAFLKEWDPSLVLDATHPYARKVSENVKKACETTQIPYCRILRQSLETQARIMDQVLFAGDWEEDLRIFKNIEGNILATTGSKELKELTALKDYEERLFVRVLPTSQVLAACENMGLKGRHLIAMQGPFSVEMNCAMIRQLNISCLLTKEAGRAGGFEEKLEAARICQIPAVVLGRPVKEEGISLNEAMELLKRDFSKAEREGKQKRRISLVGIGMGGEGQMTEAAVKAIMESQVIFGAPRMIQSVPISRFQGERVSIYKAEEILAWLNSHEEYGKASVLYSGDTGFYSGARAMTEVLKLQEDRYETEIFPGISSLSYLCARLKTSWEDVHCVTLHGRVDNIWQSLENYRRVFVLLGGESSAGALCRQMTERGFGDRRVTVAEKLSYKEEKIFTALAREVGGRKFHSLCAVLIETGDEESER